MTTVIPVALEEAVYAATRAALGPAPLATPALTRAIIDRSRRYTSERDQLSTPTDAVGDLAARAAFFTIADAMKVAIPLGELAGRGAIPAGRPLRVVDLGAGCGAMSLGLVGSLASVALEITAIDRDVDALAIAQAALRDFAGRRAIALTLATRPGDAVRAAIPPADLILMGTLVNELPEAARLPLIQRALAALSPDGALIIVEPALRETSRALHALRDAVVAAGDAHVFAPCVRQGPCPALLDPADWCHEDRAVTLPPRTAELARLTHLRDGGLRFSYLVLRTQPLALLDTAGAWRVVSAPMVQKGKHEVIGCGEPGRFPLRLMKRNRTPNNRAFESARRGDVVIVPAVPGEVRVEIDDATPVDRRTPSETRLSDRRPAS